MDDLTKSEIKTGGSSNTNDHRVHFYESDAYLIKSQADFIREALAANDSCIVLSTPEHRRELCEQLAEHANSEHLILLDAAQTLARFTSVGKLEEAHFSEIVGELIDQAAKNAGRVHVFGEMVALLWEQGKPNDAILLEKLWNELQKNRSFSLYCAYRMDGFDGGKFLEPFNEICNQHTDVTPEESYNNLENAARLKAITILQQKANSLEREIADRKEAEQRLQMSEIRYRRLFEASLDGILIVDPESTRVTDANASVCELLGLPRSEMLDKELWEIGLFKDRRANKKLFRDLSKKKLVRSRQMSLQTKDGERFIEFVSNIYQANGHQVIQCNLRDVTQRKVAEDELSAMVQKLEAQVDNLRQLHEVSTALTSTLEVKPLLKQVLDAAMTMHGTDMGLLSLSDSAKPGLTVKVSSGFNEDFLKIFAWVPPGVAACGICYERRERVVIEDTEINPIFIPYREAARDAGFRSCHSTPLITRSGSIIGVLSVHFREPHRPSERELHFMDLYARMAADLIENAQLHQQLQQQLIEREELLRREHSARLDAQSADRAKDEFLATVSHELRTPLTSLLGWTRLLRLGNLPPQKFKRALESVERSVHSQKQIIEDLLDVSGIISGKLRLDLSPIQLETIIADAMEAVRPAAEAKEILIDSAVDSPMESFTGDSARIQQIVCNLLSNSIKFSPKGGKIEIRLKQSDSRIRIVVRDNGQGIKPDFLPYVFDRFRQADGSITRKHAGLGLGLAIVRHLAELHDGTVWAESMGEGQGATFTVELPIKFVPEQIHLIEPQLSVLDTKAPTDLSMEGLRVLIVEDESDTREMLMVMFTQNHALAKSVGSASEALKLMKKWVPDILLSDIGMPDMDGYELIRKVRALGPEEGGQMPAVAITAYAKPEDQDRAIQEGFSVHLPKPIEPVQLASIVQNLTEKIRRREFSKS